MSYPSNCRFFVLLFFSLVSFSACSNSHGHAFVAEGYVVFDYTSGASHPIEKMSVFISTDSDFSVVGIELASEHKDFARFAYEWSSRKIYAMNGMYWCQNLSVPDDAHFPEGRYVVSAFFSDGSKENSSFVLHYPSYCINNDVNHVLPLLERDFKPVSELYDKTKQKNINSAIEKMCYISSDRHVLCVLPKRTSKGL